MKTRLKEQQYIWIILLAISQINYSFGQCNQSGVPDQEPYCDLVIPFCNLQDLNNYSAQMFMQDTPDAFVPDPLCPNGIGDAHNMSWFGFIAGSTSFTITIDYQNCTQIDNGNGGFNTGFQFGVYTDCNYTDSPFCEGFCTQQTQGSETFVINDLDIGDDYFIFLDGCAGSICDYSVTVTGGQFNALDEFGSFNCETMNCDEICVGADEVIFSANNVNGILYDLSIDYEWTIDPPLPGQGGSFMVSDGDFQLELDFSNASAQQYELCISADNCCDDTDQFCDFITVVLIDDEVFTMDPVCANDFPITVDPDEEDPNMDATFDYGDSGWQGPDISGPGVTTFTASNAFGCEWEQSIDVAEVILESPIDITVFFCQGSSITIADEEFEDTFENFQYIPPPLAANGCDQALTVTAYEILVEPEILVGACNADGSIDLTLNYFFENEVEFAAAGGTFNWIWTYQGGPLAGTENQSMYNVPFNQNGSYSVIFFFDITFQTYNDATFMVEDVVLDESTCNTTSFINQYVENINFNDLIPAVNFTSAPDILCPESLVDQVYSIDIDGYVGNEAGYMIEWNTNGIPITGGDVNSPSITVDFTGETMGVICYEVVGPCNPNPSSDCINVSVSPSDVPEVSLIAETCPDSQVMVEALNITQPFDTIIWDLSGATLVAGDITTTGPLTLTWPGNTMTQTVTATIDYNENCLNYPDDASISFIIDPAFLGVDCFSDQESVTFTWPDVIDATDYMVVINNITSANAGTVNFDPANNTLVVTGLNQGDLVDLQLEATNANDPYCAMVLSNLAMCETKVCPVVTADLQSPYDEFVCIGLNESIQDLNLTVTFADPAEDTGIGTNNFSGPGIIDPVIGTFDPTVAGVGDHTIDYYFDFDGCRTVAAVEIKVRELPTLEMQVTDDVICIGEEITVQFNGTYDQSNTITLQNTGANIIDMSDPQNIVVSWDTPGPKILSASVPTDGCGDITPPDIEVNVESIPAISLGCSPTSSSITIEWNTEPEYESFILTLDDGTVIPLDATEDSYTIPGLDPLTDIGYTLTAVSGNSCDDVSDSSNCVSVDCPEPNLALDLAGTIPVCLTSATAPIQITPDFDDTVLTPGYTTMWDGDGVDASGLFDPSVAGEGTHNIQFEIIDDNCRYPAEVEFVVEMVPELALAADTPTQICIDQAWALDYTGDTNGNFDYTWATDDGQMFTGFSDQSIEFNTPGSYALTLNAATANCSATEINAMVEVIDSLISPVISCDVGVDTILISWIEQNDDCDNQYSISINGNTVSTQDEAIYLAQNVMPDTEITIKVTNEGMNCVCTDKSTTITCRTLECPPVSVEFDQDALTVCRTEFEVFTLIDLNLTSSTDLSDFNFVFDGDGVSGNQFDPNGLDDGTYLINGTATKNFCDYPATRTVTLTTIPTTGFDYPAEICIEDDVVINYIGDDITGFTYDWSTLNGPAINDLNTTLDIDAPGLYTYEFTIQDGTCVSTPVTVEFTVIDSLRTPIIDCDSSLDAIDIAFSAAATDCDGELSVMIDGQMYTGDISTGMINLPQLQAETDYEITVMNSSQCSCSDKSTTITCRTADCPVVNFTPDCTEALDNITLDWTLDQLDCPSDLSVMIDGQMYTGDVSTGNIFLTELQADTEYEFIFSTTSECGCDSTYTTSCLTPPCPDMNFSNTCDSGLDFINFSWDLDLPDCPSNVEVFVDGVAYSGDISSQAIPFEDLSANSEVEIEIIVTSDCGCNDAFTVLCMTDPCPQVNLELQAPEDFYCLSDSSVDGQLVVLADGQDVTDQATFMGLGVSNDGSFTVDSGLLQTGSGVQTYEVEYELAGCIYNATTEVNYIIETPVEVEVVDPCPGEDFAELNIVNPVFDQNVEYLINGVPMDSLTGVPIESGDYTIEAVTGGLCTTNDEATFTSQPDVELMIVGDTLSFPGEVKPYTIESNYQFDSIVWSINDVDFVGDPVDISYVRPGLLCVSAYLDGDCVTVICRRQELDTERLLIPNIFDPTALEPDNALQIFSNVEVQRIVSFSVFDRWGNRVFHVEDAALDDDRAKWYGDYNGEQLEQGVYIYAGEVEFLSGQFKVFGGDVTLIR